MFRITLSDCKSFSNEDGKQHEEQKNVDFTDVFDSEKEDEDLD